MKRAVAIVVAALHAVTLGPALVQAQAVSQPPPVAASGVDERVGERAAVDLPFTDASGRPFELGSLFDGQTPVILVLSYNRCQVLCSMILRGLTDALGRLDQVPGRDYRVATISIDPNETPEVATKAQASVLNKIGRAAQTERWPFLVGADPEIRRLADSLGFRYAWDPRTDQYAHPAVLFVLTGDGTISRYLYGVRYDAGAMADALETARGGDVWPSSEQIASSVLSCFRFDPAARKYGAAIQTMFRVGAGVIFGALVTLILLLYRWEKKRARNS